MAPAPRAPGRAPFGCPGQRLAPHDHRRWAPTSQSASTPRPRRPPPVDHQPRQLGHHGRRASARRRPRDRPPRRSTRRARSSRTPPTRTPARAASGVLSTTATVAIADPRLVMSAACSTRCSTPRPSTAPTRRRLPSPPTLSARRARSTATEHGTAPPDAGVIEYQRRPPTATATAVGPFVLGTPTAFQGTADDLDPGDSVTTAWAFSDGTAATALAPAHTFDLAGPFTATLTATDSAGLTATAQATGTIAPRPPATSTSTLPVTPPPTDTTKPVVSGARFDPKTFRASSANTATSAAAKKKCQAAAGRQQAAPVAVGGRLGHDHRRRQAQRAADRVGQDEHVQGEVEGQPQRPLVHLLHDEGHAQARRPRSGRKRDRVHRAHRQPRVGRRRLPGDDHAQGRGWQHRHRRGGDVHDRPLTVT